MTETRPPGQPTLPLMRVLLTIGALLVLAAGVQLYVLTVHTDRYFAWTIANPLTASSIGAFYLGSVAISGIAAYQRRWDLARVGVPGILVLLWLTLGATLAHLGTFHFHDGSLPRILATAWLVLYIAVPVLLTLAYVLQLRQPGAAPARKAPMPAWYRWSCALVSAPILVAGVALYAFPDRFAPHWPWQLTQIAAQALAAWLTALAVLLIAVVVEGDARRTRPASLGMLLLAVLALVALARYPQTAHGNAIFAWIATWIVIGLLGWYGVRRALT